ncbi:diguanylate cyclase [Geotalea uraniireducens Rf4]|uniref:diguanylate cyclase n=1 Tax=Geotalea uraniireducens (strain Rf4) TaxID=351605 RepID=A5G6P7_GEOUR|nr:diguanylate cyclase [Geotalea uraniireducens Rf4]
MKVKRFRHWAILPKIMTISVVSVAVIAGVVMFYFLPLVERKIMDGKKEGTKYVVEVAFGILAGYDALAKSGQLTEADARQRAALEVKKLRYKETEYFWINDRASNMVMHPTRPELDGTNLSDNRDPRGTFVFKEFVRVCNEKGAGFVEYLWPKPGERLPVAKISYVKLYAPWGWIVGSGIYVDDVEKDMARLRWNMAIGTMVFAALILSLSLFIGISITRLLKNVIGGLQDIASGKGDVDLSKRIATSSIDEIGVLSSEFNGLMDSISSLTIFKKVIEEDDTLDDVYFRLGSVFTEDLGLGGCVIYEISGSQGKMRPVYPSFVATGELYCNADILDNHDLCKAKRTGHPISSLTYPRICKQFSVASGKEHFCIPMTVGGGTVGVVQFAFDKSDTFTDSKENERRLFKAEQYIKESLSVIEAKRLMNTLRESSLKDPLTGLHNRRFLQEYTEKLVAGAKRRRTLVGLIMCDLDYFKQVNDAYGHNVGDIVLRETASIIRTSVREADIVVRFGGEEFLVVLFDIGAGDALNVAEKIRVNVQNARIKIPEGVIQKTISLGVSEFPADSETFWHSIKYADVALYKAKEAGRNKVMRFTGDMWTDEHF